MKFMAVSSIIAEVVYFCILQGSCVNSPDLADNISPILDASKLDSQISVKGTSFITFSNL